MSKEKVIIYGNCQANALGGLLKISEEFSERYDFVRVTPVHRVKVAEHREFCENLVKHCAAFLYQPVSDKFRGGGFGYKTVCSYLSNDAFRASFPSLQFYGYHALSAPVREVNSEFASSVNSFFGMPSSDLFHPIDVLECYCEGFDLVDAIDKFSNGSANTRDQILSITLNSIEQMRISEEKHSIDIKFSYFLENNYKNQQLFHTPRHPTGFSLLQVVESFLSYLDIKISEEERQRIVKRDPLCIPQYPSQRVIHDKLGLDFEKKLQFKSKSVSLSCEQFVSQLYQAYNTQPSAVLNGWLDTLKKSMNRVL
ncbi:WcbI family polysaccharide biosynthesis putative acetyltransferase [Halomonas sp. SpR8]|uniref:WcbI family polysaccharide biosynthesis putative acetyltransferase n=1 Tax=Halomonas sp. SpR8 TaxID=3050463 RepID=UPI0027E5A256|nr:WcbI family polysaccharide biosynthesis putative acetyltransferase [Halomonas sp. SpR8]MDQ7727285.1 WcbI family polysaccharide biosynthesis putative acetyltransferase [Halomonas sp. SpR8]